MARRSRSPLNGGSRLWRQLVVLLLLFGPPGPAPADDVKPLTAILLVARSQLPDPNFADSVVLVMNNLGPGPVGVILNRPTQLPLSRLFPELNTTLLDRAYFGGPVAFGSVTFLFRAKSKPEHAVEACAGVYFSADRELLLHLLSRDKPTDGLRIFVGYSGWTTGQLEAEIARGDWTARRAESDTIFNGQSMHPWPAPRPAEHGT
jgi:putative transcriptional regulator